LKEIYKGSIRKELLRNILFIILLAIVIGYGIFLNIYMRNEQKRDIALVHTISQIIGQDVAKIAYMDNISVASDVTTQLHSFQNLSELILYKENKEILFQYAQDNKTHITSPCTKEMFLHPIVEHGTLKLCTKLSYKGVAIADAQYIFKTETIMDIFVDSLHFLLLLLVVMLTIAYLLSRYEANKFTSPILSLVDFLENIQNENFLQKRVTTKEKNEFGILYAEINTMLERIEESYDELKLAAAAFEIPTAMLITDANRKILRVNRAFKEMTGLNENELIGTTPSFLTTQQNDTEIVIPTKKHTSIDVRLHIQMVKKEDGSTLYNVISLINLSKQKQAEKKLEQLTHYDPLTGLMNRSLLEQILTDTLNSSEMREKSYGFLCFDIENFRLINEGYSFEFGNKLLQQVAIRIKEHYTKTKCIAKISVDEFFLCFEYENKKEDALVAVMEMEAQKVLQLFNEPFIIDDKAISLSVHIGITLSNINTKQDAKEIIKESIGAVNISKDRGISVSFYNQTYQKNSLEHIDMYSQLLTAIKENQFRLYYQLQNNDKKEVIGAEALMRWVKPDGTVVAPYMFIPILEDSGLILKLSNWIVETACKQLAQWQKEEATKHLTISINACTKEFNSPSFLTNIQNNLEKYNIPHGLLKVELLESMLADDIEVILAKMNALKAIGVKLSLDDFGTGYSSLSYLKRLPIDQIKVDQSFVKNITTSEKDRAIVKSIIMLKDAFNVRVIAEGVETEQDAKILKELGCKLYQGYYFAKPKPIEEITLNRGGVIRL